MPHVAATSNGVDFVLLQDLSSSYEGILHEIIDEIPHLIKNIAQKHASSRFALASFIDKPLGDFGYPSTDYCYDLHLPLSYVDIDAEGNGTVASGIRQTLLSEQLDALAVGSGRDWHENQLGALVHAILSSNTGWDNSNGNAKVLTLVTDAGYHLHGDEPDELGLVRTNNSIMRYSLEPSEWCTSEKYPSLSDLSSLIRTNDVNLLVITTDEMKGYYERLVKALGVTRGLVVSNTDDTAIIANAIEAGLLSLRDSGIFGIAANLRYQELINNEDQAIVDEFWEMVDHDDGESSQAEFLSPKFSRSDFSGFSAGLSPAMFFRTSSRSASNTSDVPKAEQGSLGLCSLDTIFEIVWAQDASGSFDSEKEALYSAMPSVLDTIMTIFPGSRFAFESFVDKPVEPFGYGVSGDYCAHMRVGLTDDQDLLVDSLRDMVVRSGGDIPEAQLHALIHPSLSLKTGWTREAEKDGKRVVRVVALVTDAPYHEAGDTDLPPYFQSASWYDCAETDYPTAENVADSLIYDQVFPLVLTTPRNVPFYERLIQRDMNLNGSVEVVGDDDELVSNLYGGFIQGLSRICNFTSIIAQRSVEEVDLLDDSSPTDLTIHFQQLPKFLSVVYK